MSKKNRAIREKEMLAAEQREEVITNVLKFSKKRFKKFDEVILQLYLAQDLSSHFADRRVCKVYECFSRLASKNRSVDRAMLKNVLIYLEKYSSLIKSEDYIHAVYNMVLHRAYWKKDIFEWKPSSKANDGQLNELICYLFCDYAIPKFLFKAFFEKENMSFISWLIHIGTGKRIKDLSPMPIAFTQKMGHYFLQAPVKFNITEALRWAQVKGMNGDDRLADRIAYSWIGTKPFDNEEMWESFIRILVSGGMFNYDKLTELIDYVREMKRENRAYNLKGRTLQSLMRQSDEWHKKAVLIRGAQFWNPSGINGYKAEYKQEMIKLVELSGSKLLADEGRTMKHCVGSYSYHCVSGKTAIFSMRKYLMGVLTDTLATIEVNLSMRRVMQAKAKMNRKITDEARKHLNVWADKNELSISPYL